MNSCEVEKKRLKYHISMALTVFFMCLAFIFAAGMNITDDETVYIVSMMFIVFAAAGGIMAVRTVRAEIKYMEARKICCPKCRRNPNYDNAE